MKSKLKKLKLHMNMELIEFARHIPTKYKVDKDGDKDTEKETITVAKIGSHWYVVG